MSAARILVVEDNALNLKLVRDVLQYAGLRGRRGDHRARRASTLAHEQLARPGPDGPAAARASTAPRRCGRCGATRGRRRRPGRRRHRVRHEGGPRPGARRRASTATSRSRSASGRCRRRSAASCGRTRHDLMPSRPILAVDDQPQNLRLLDAVLEPARLPGAAPRRRARRRWTLLERGRRRPRAARHPDAGHGRLRGVPADPRATRHRVPAGRDDHRERRRRRRSGRSRPAPTTSSPSRSTRASCWPGSRRWPGSSATTTRSSARPPSSRRGTRARGAGRRRRSPSSSGLNRLRRFLSPAAGRAGRRLRRRVVPGEPPSRDRRRVLRPARLHPVRRVERARGGDGRAARVPRGARRADLPRSRARSSASPATG